MAGIEIDTNDIVAYGRQLQRATEAATFLMRGAVRKTAFDIQADAQRAAPVDTGKLKNSILVGFQGTSADLLQATVTAYADYSKYVEFGTSRQAPQPYLGPAGDKHEPALKAAIGVIADKLGSAL